MLERSSQENQAIIFQEKPTTNGIYHQKVQGPRSCLKWFERDHRVWDEISRYSKSNVRIPSWWSHLDELHGWMDCSDSMFRNFQRYMPVCYLDWSSTWHQQVRLDGEWWPWRSFQLGWLETPIHEPPFPAIDLHRQRWWRLEKSVNPWSQWWKMVGKLSQGI